MQLIKDDVKTINGIVYFNMGNFYEIVKFYEQCKDDMELVRKEYPKAYSKYIDFVAHKRKGIPVDEILNNITWRNWLFSYCFKDGLK